MNFSKLISYNSYSVSVQNLGVFVNSEFDDFAPAPKKAKSPGDEGFIGPVMPTLEPKKDTAKKAANKKDEKVKPKGATIEVRKPKTQTDY